ncbi:Peptidyl-prolyl cis-trans isomerase D [subsurface metagenome]
MILLDLRKSIKPMMWIIIVAFGASLPLMYLRSRTGDQQKPLAKVNGVSIPYATFARSYSDVYERYQQTSGEQISPQVETYLKYQVLAQLITNEILRQEANRAKIRISEEELTEAIERIMRSFPSREAFMRFLNSQHISYRDLKEQIIKQLAINELTQRIGDSVGVTDQEVKDYWLRENEKIKAVYIYLSPKKYEKEVVVSQEEITIYYEKHKEDFTIPEKVKADYLLISSAEFTKEIKVTAKELKSYYEGHLANFEAPEKRKVSHILIKLLPSASKKDEENAKKEIEEIQKKLEKGADFTTLAKKYSQDTPSAEKGGDLGFFTYTEMIPSFSRAAFSLEKEGEVSGIVKSPFGYHLIKLTGIKQAYTEPFEKVKSRINKLLIEQKSDDLAKKEAEGMRERIKEKKITFTDYVKKHPFRYNSTPFFSSTEKVEGVGWTPQFNQVAFSLKPGEISSVVQIPQGYSILKLVERKTSRIPPLKEITQKIKEKVVQEKAKRTAEEKAKQIQKEIKEGENLSSLVKKFGLEYKSLEYLKRGDWIEELDGTDREKFMETAFSLAKGGVSPPVWLSKGYYVIQLTGRDLSLEEFTKEREKFTQDLTSQKRAEELNLWLQKIREKAKIEDNSSLFFSP